MWFHLLIPFLFPSWGKISTGEMLLFSNLMRAFYITCCNIPSLYQGKINISYCVPDSCHGRGLSVISATPNSSIRAFLAKLPAAACSLTEDQSITF